MAFSQTIKDQAYTRARGMCERCNKVCRRINGVSGYNYPDSEFHHRLSLAAGGDDSLSNCEHLCIACHEDTGSYGRH